MINDHTCSSSKVYQSYSGFRFNQWLFILISNDGKMSSISFCMHVKLLHITSYRYWHAEIRSSWMYSKNKETWRSCSYHQLKAAEDKCGLCDRTVVLKLQHCLWA